MPDIKQGDSVHVPSPVMTVEAIKFNEDTGAKRALCSWKDGEGNEHHRWFEAAEIGVVGGDVEAAESASA